MNIKSQKLYSIILLLLFSFGMQGQEKTSKFYFGFKAGVKSAFGNSKQETETYISAKFDPQIAMGKGYEAELLVGYQFNKNIGVEMGYNYFLNGKAITIEPRDRYKMDVNNYSATVIQVKPSIVFKTDYKKFNPYIKAGLNIGLNSKFKNTRNSITRENLSSIDFVSSGYKKNPIGYHSSLGIEMKATKRITFFSEFSVNVLNITRLTYLNVPGSGTFSFDGNPEFDEFPSEGFELYFFDSYGSKVSVSNYGLDFGIKYQL
jgi:opacity protein-like surface antigen